MSDRVVHAHYYGVAVRGVTSSHVAIFNTHGAGLVIMRVTWM
jgi:hypothetical protein